MSRPPNRRRSRPLALESLEPRAVPAGLVQQITLPPEFVTSAYSSAVANGEILVSGTENNQPVILEMDGSGTVKGKIEPTLPAGYNAGNIAAISDNGRWALGQCRVTSVGNVPVLTVIWNLADPVHPQVVEALTGVTDLLPSPVFEHASIEDDGSFVFNSFKLGTNLVHSDGTLEKIPRPSDSNPTRPSAWQVRAVSSDGRVMVGFDSFDTGKLFIWHDLTPSELSIPPAAPGGAAETISTDGRLVGGVVANVGGGAIGIYPQATVWVDGSPRILRDPAGNELDGSVDYILPQSGDAQHGWIVIGRTYGLVGFEEQYIAFADSTFSDYTLVPLHEFIQQQSGTDSPVNVSYVLNVELRDNSLYVFSAIVRPISVPIGRITCSDDPPPSTYDGRITGLPRPCVNPLADTAPSEGSFSGFVYVVPLSTAGQSTSTISLDVNLDGQVSPADALLLINTINGQLVQGINDAGLPPGASFPRLDVNRDGQLSSIDVLIVINRLNEDAASAASASTDSTTSAAEGEPAATTLNTERYALAADEFFLALGPSRRK
jgi:hypothetical protein